MLHALELEFIHFIQQLRNPPLDQFFKLLDFFDRLEFFFILIPIIWLGQGWKAGLRLFSILLLSSLSNHALKEFFLSPRPFHLDPQVGIIQVSGLGFPSGAAQTVILLSGLLLRFWKNSWKWLVASVYILLVSFSRIYLGLHFPSDIVGGWLVGMGLFATYVYIYPLIEKQLERLQPFSLFLLSQMTPALLMVSIPSIRVCSVAIGMGMGLFIAYAYRLFLMPPKNSKEYVLRAIIGVSGTFACYALTLLISTSNATVDLFFRFLLIGLWISLGSPVICHTLYNTSLKVSE